MLIPTEYDKISSMIYNGLRSGLSYKQVIDGLSVCENTEEYCTLIVTLITIHKYEKRLDTTQ